ncbi:MAG: iron ABC transporter permease [Desulfovibrio sp.]|jgi:iron(III) transport system permease protein|nr:iron ABC transporter permease [Desulfovibrio sp.]
MSSVPAALPFGYSRARKFKNALLGLVTNPYNIIVVVTIVLLAYLIVMPLVEMITTTFELQQVDVRRVRGAAEGQFTLYYWNRLLNSRLSKALLWIPLRNSLCVAVSVSFLSILLGSLLAWLIVRSDMPFKKVFSLAVIIPYMLPSWCKSMAWITVFKNSRVGGRTGFLSALGIETPNWLAYGPVPIVLVLVIHYYAYAYLLVSAALSSLNSELEEMGEITGATKPQILRNITMPLVLPAILSSVILTFSKAMGTFGVPAFLGMKVNFNTISTTLYQTIRNRETTTGYAVALILIGISSLFVFLNQKAIGARKSFATIGGKGSRPNLIRLGLWKYPITALVILLLLTGIIGPLIILVIDTFMLRPGIYSFSNFSLHFWLGLADLAVYEGEPGVLRNPQFWQALKNTMLLVVCTSVVASLAGQIMGYIVSRGRTKFSGKLIEQLVFVPYLIPSIAFGAIYLSMFAVARFTVPGTGFSLVPALYGTFTLLVLVSVVKHLPFSCRAGISNMLQIGVELEESAAIQGSSFFTRFRRIVLPLSKGGFISGFMLIFISIMKELDLIILIIVPAWTTLPYMAYRYSNSNLEPYSNVVAVILFSIVFMIYAILNIGGKADIAKSMGG